MTHCSSAPVVGGGSVLGVLDFPMVTLPITTASAYLSAFNMCTLYCTFKAFKAHAQEVGEPGFRSPLSCRGSELELLLPSIVSKHQTMGQEG